MFFKRIPRWKFKRFFKKVISAIIFFSLLFSFSLSCNASISSGTYDSWQELVDDENTSIYGTYSDGVGFSFSSFPLYEANNVTYPFYALLNARPIRDVVFDFSGDNVLREFDNGDVFLFSGVLYVQFNDNSPSFDYSSFADSCYFRWGLHKDSSDSSVYSTINFTLSEFDYESHYEGSVGSNGAFSIKVPFTIEYSFPFDGYFTSFEISLGGMENATKFIIYPAQYISDQNIIYFVGDETLAPQYRLPHDQPLTDFENTESAVLDDFSGAEEDFFNRFDDPSITDFGSWANKFWPAQGVGIGNWLAAASGLFSTLWDWLPWPIVNVIEFLLVFGVFGFVLNLVSHIRRS